MGEELSCKSVETSDRFQLSRIEIYKYTVNVFGISQAKRYKQKILDALDSLSVYYTAYPECRHLATKSRRYRNIILDAHLIIYRITDVRIEVLDIVHSKSSVSRIRAVRRIRV